MDFVSDALFDGRRLRALIVVDAYTRETLAIEVDQGIKGEQVVDAVTRIAVRRGVPRAIRVDVRLEGARSLGLRERRYAGLQPAGKPTDNAFVESFNGRFRDECLNTHCEFKTLSNTRSVEQTSLYSVALQGTFVVRPLGGGKVKRCLNETAGSSWGIRKE